MAQVYFSPQIFFQMVKPTSVQRNASNGPRTQNRKKAPTLMAKFKFNGKIQTWQSPTSKGKVQKFYLCDTRLLAKTLNYFVA